MYKYVWKDIKIIMHLKKITVDHNHIRKKMLIFSVTVYTELKK